MSYEFSRSAYVPFLPPFVDNGRVFAQRMDGKLWTDEPRDDFFVLCEKLGKKAGGGSSLGMVWD